MEGSDADEEWSDEEAVKSGSATALSDTDYDGTTAAAENLVTMTTKPTTCNRFDPVDTILDKIDAEIGGMTSPTNKSSSPHSKNSQNLNGSYQAFNEPNTNSRGNPTLNTSHSGTDTGLGTSSLMDDNMSDVERLKIGRNMQYLSNGASQYVNIPRNQDNHTVMTAQQVEKKFQEIMNKKKGGYLDGLHTRIQSDQETIRTEDFEETFNNGLVDTDNETSLNDSVSTVKANDSGIVLKSTTDKSASASIHPSLYDNTPHVSLHPGHPIPHITIAMPNQRYHQSPYRVTPRSGYNSDLDSVRTEDFEAKFNDMVALHGLPQDSDAESKRGVNFTDRRNHVSNKTALPSVAAQSIHHGRNDVHNMPKSPPKSKNELQVWSAPHTLNTSHSKPKSPGRRHTQGTTPPRKHTPTSAQKRTPPKRKMEHGASLDDMYRYDDNCDAMTDNTEVTDDELARNSQEIAKESARIQREMELERRAKVGTSPVMRSPVQTPVATPTRVCRVGCVGSVDVERSVQFCDRSGGMESDTEIYHRKPESEKSQSTMEMSMRLSQADLDDLQYMIKEHRQTAEESRTKLMLTEFKRNNAMKELDKVTQELNIKRKKMQSFDDQVKNKMEEIRQIEAMGLSKDELMGLNKDREILRAQVRNLEAVQLERNELIGQIEAAKDDLFNEHKRGRIEVDVLHEEIESLKTKLEDVHADRDGFYQKAVVLEDSVRTLEDERNHIIKDQTQVLYELQEKAKQESHALKQQSMQETEERQMQLQELANKVHKVQQELAQRDECNLQLREEVMALRQEVAARQELTENMTEEHKRNLNNLKKDMDAALVQLRESCFLDKQKSLEKLREQLDQERKDSLMKAENRMMKKLADAEKSAAIKEDTVEKMQELQAQIEEESRQKCDTLRAKHQEEIQEVVRKERQLLEQERDWLIRRERESVVTEMKKKLTELAESVDQKQKQILELKTKVEEGKQECEEQKQLNRQAIKEKLVSIARAKEMCKVDKEAELGRLKERLLQDSKKEIDKMRESAQLLEQELKHLRHERQLSVHRDKENRTVFDRMERMVVNEINEECRRTASILEVTPRKVNLSSFRVEKGATVHSPNTKRSVGKAATTSALANLRACTEELRNHVMELKQEVEAQRAALVRSKKDKDEGLEDFRRQSEREKTHELESLKERLIKEHCEELTKIQCNFEKDKNLQLALHEKDNEIRELHRGLHSWKEETAEKFAKKFEDELSRELDKKRSKQLQSQRDLERVNASQQREIERLEREVHRLAETETRLLSHSVPPLPSDTRRKVKQLQGRIHNLQVENNALWHLRPATSVPDMSKLNFESEEMSGGDTPAGDNKISEPPQQPDNKTVSSSSEKPSLMNQKMTEMNHLQHTLTHQTKELRQLERAYNQLSTRYTRSPQTSLYNRPKSALR